MRFMRQAAGIVASVGLLAGTAVVTAAPAQAFGPLSLKYAVVDTSNCYRVAGELLVYPLDAGCQLYDTADNTFFKKQAEGRAVKIELRNSNGMVAKVEWHPWGDELWVYDTRNDGDSIYVTLQWGDATFGPVSAPGTDAEWEYAKESYSIPEGEQVWIKVYDSLDQYGVPTSPIGTYWVGKA